MEPEDITSEEMKERTVQPLRFPASEANTPAKKAVIEDLWDALSNILEDPEAEISDRHRRAGITAIEKAAEERAGPCESLQPFPVRGYRPGDLGPGAEAVGRSVSRFIIEVGAGGDAVSSEACGHSACRQHYIDTGETDCIEEGGDQ